jgi:hypothetical protein
MIPPVPPAGSDNESLVFSILSTAPGTDDWIVLHQVQIAEHVSQERGEADMIILVPGHGCLFLEVKGYVEFRNGLWFFGGEEKGTSKSPFDQANGAMHSVRRWLVSHGYEDLTRFVLASAAAFVKTIWTEPLLGARSEEIIDATMIDQDHPEKLVGAIVKAITRARSAIEETRGLRPGAIGELSKEQADQFASIVRPVIHPPFLAQNLARAQIREFTSDQLLALDVCRVRRQVIFEGLAGTGKSVLAIEAAARMASDGNRVLLICSNELARDRTKRALANRDNLSVKGVFELALEVVDPESRRRFVEHRKWDELLKSSRLALVDGKNRDPFDVLIVDEAQDAMSTEIVEFLSLWLLDGILAGRWIFFLDPNQLLSSTKREFLSRFKESHIEALSRPLLVNCRNSIGITEFTNVAAQLVEPMRYDPLLVRNRSNMERPRVHLYTSEEDQADQVMRHVMSLINDHVDPNDIVVLSTKREGSCANLLLKRGLEDILEPFSHKSSNKVRFETVHRFKGLESLYVVLTDLDRVPDERSQIPIREVLYVGATRANAQLTCFASASVGAYFSRMETEAILA